MIQDIYPHRYDNTYKTDKPGDDDLLIICRGQKVIVRCSDKRYDARETEQKNTKIDEAAVPDAESLNMTELPAEKNKANDAKAAECHAAAEKSMPKAELPDVQTAERLWSIDRDSLTYLFAIDDRPYFLLNVGRDEAELYQERDGYRFEHILTVRGMQPLYTAFAAAVGAHLAHWYTGSRFCGRCGHRNIHAESQRAMVCPECGQLTFPRINPIMIAAVTDGDKLLVAKYNRKHFDTRNDHYVLLAGYVEIGESYEDTLRREVREETGLEVRNIRYIGSQPWPFSDTSIAGFYAEADSTLPLKKQADELAELKWLKRDEVPARPNLTSITDNLIEWFRHGKSVEEILKERDEMEKG